MCDSLVVKESAEGLIIEDGIAFFAILPDKHQARCRVLYNLHCSPHPEDEISEMIQGYQGTLTNSKESSTPKNPRRPAQRIPHNHTSKGLRSLRLSLKMHRSASDTKKETVREGEDTG